MPENNRIGGRAAPYMRIENNGMFSSPGPYIGIIKNNIDPTCAGRLQVYIPQHGGPDENDPGNWLTLSYASPFRGQTRQRSDLDWYVDYQEDITTTDGSLQENSFQSYGFWFVPPDLNGRVLCFFANCDPSQGYWTACIQDSMDSHMIPAIGAVVAAKSNNPGSGGYIWQPSGANPIPSHTILQNYLQISGSGQSEIPYRLPVSEPVIVNQANSNPSTPSQVLMVPQVYQSLQLGLQGLAFDFIRGSTSASSIRENPSQVFGISTPGRLSSFANVNLSKSVLNTLTTYINSGNANSVSQNSFLYKALNCMYRTGGHQFVMDDGTIDGQDQGIRIRTTAGNEILLDDTNGQIYIINSPGTAWIELSPSGYIDIFSAKDFSVHSQENINFHAEQDIRFHAGKQLYLHADGNMQVETSGTATIRGTAGTTIYDKTSLSLGTGGDWQASSKSAEFNTGSQFIVQAATIQIPGSAGTVQDPGAIHSNKQIKVSQQAGSKAWWQTGTYKSIVNRAPAHEPWPGHEINGIKTSSVPQGNAFGLPISRSQTGTTSSGVRGTAIGPSINESQIAKQPLTGTVCGLTVTETQALLAQIGQRESGMNYSAVNQLGYAGKYQFGYTALQDTGYIRRGVSGTNQTVLNNPANWTGGPSGTVNSLNDWLNNASAQESAMMQYTQSHCKSLQQYGVLTVNSTPEEIGGYLMAAHLVGVGGAHLLFELQNNLSSSGNQSLTQDANGTTSQSYYLLGSNAVQLGDSSTQA